MTYQQIKILKCAGVGLSVLIGAAAIFFAVFNFNNFEKEKEKNIQTTIYYDKEIEMLSKSIKEIEIQLDEKDKEIEKLKKQSNSAKGNYRLTSFWAGDGYESGSCTGSGLCEKDFEINEKGWYTYQGKLVIATATPYLLNYGFEKRDGISYHRYKETLFITIQGERYEAIVLDSCGACMRNKIIDLFVSNSKSALTTNKIEVEE